MSIKVYIMWKKTTYTSSPTCHQILLTRITCDIVMRTRYLTLQMMSGIPLVKWTYTTTFTPYNKAHFTFQNKSALKESVSGERSNTALPVNLRYQNILCGLLVVRQSALKAYRTIWVAPRGGPASVLPLMGQRTHASESCAAALPRKCVL